MFLEGKIGQIGRSPSEDDGEEAYNVGYGNPSATTLKGDD